MATCPEGSTFTHPSGHRCACSRKEDHAGLRRCDGCGTSWWRERQAGREGGQS